MWRTIAPVSRSKTVAPFAHRSPSPPRPRSAAMLPTDRGERAVTRTTSTPASRAAASAARDRSETVPSERSSVPSRSIAASRGSAGHGAASVRATVRMSGGHRRTPAHASSSVTSTISVPRNATIRPNPPLAARSAAATPRRDREHPVGGGRCAASLEVAEHGHPRLEPRQLLEARGDERGDAAEPLEAERVDAERHGRAGRRIDPLRDDDDGVAASLRGAATHDVWRRRRGRRAPRGRGSRPRPTAIPAYVAIQPRVRPITSTTITRLWDSAVVVIRSIASVAIWTAVSKPNVTSVAGDVVVDRLRDADERYALRGEPQRGAERPVAADRRRRASIPLRSSVSQHGSAQPSPWTYGSRRDVPRIVPPRWRIPRTALRSSGRWRPSISPSQPSRIPTTSAPWWPSARATTAADHGVQPRAVTARREDPELLHRAH